MSKSLDREELAKLRSKYAEILRLRVACDVEPPRAALARLAREFPGALRELDQLALEEIRRRIERLRRAEADVAEVEPWMHATALFHHLARGALAVKRWLAGRKCIDDATRRAFAEAAATLGGDADVRAWSDALDLVACPPDGKLTSAVVARVAARLGVSDARARELIFGPRA